MYDYTWFNYSFQRSTMKSQVIYCRELRYQYNYSSRYFCWRAWPFYIIRSALKLLFTNTKIHKNKICLGIQKEQHIFLVTCKISQEKILWCAAEIQNVNETYTTNYMLYIRLIRGFKKKTTDLRKIWTLRKNNADSWDFIELSDFLIQKVRVNNKLNVIT